MNFLLTDVHIGPEDLTDIREGLISIQNLAPI